jgi:hypothetical protein
LAPQGYALEGVGLPCETEPHVKNGVRIAPCLSHLRVENHAAEGGLKEDASNISLIRNYLNRPKRVIPDLIRNLSGASNAIFQGDPESRYPVQSQV